MVSCHCLAKTKCICLRWAEFDMNVSLTQTICLHYVPISRMPATYLIRGTTSGLEFMRMTVNWNANNKTWPIESAQPLVFFFFECFSSCDSMWENRTRYIKLPMLSWERHAENGAGARMPYRTARAVNVYLSAKIYNLLLGVSPIVAVLGHMTLTFRQVHFIIVWVKLISRALLLIRRYKTTTTTKKNILWKERYRIVLILRFSHKKIQNWKQCKKYFVELAVYVTARILLITEHTPHNVANVLILFCSIDGLTPWILRIG